MTLDIGVVVLFASCLQSITTAVPVHHPIDIPRNGTRNSIEQGSHFLNPFAESSVASRNFADEITREEPPSMSLSLKPTQKKRDKEEEADSANGKSPIPILYKKSFSFGDELGNSKVFANQKDYAGFPPFTGMAGGGGVPYQRQRRSYHLPLDSNQQSPLHKKLASDEMEIRLDNDRDREAFLRLMAFLAARETSPSNYNLLNTDELSFLKPDEDEGNFIEDERDAPLDLGYYGEEPFLPASSSPYDSSSYNNKPISLMSSGTPADLSRMGLHLSQVPGSHGLYLTSPPNAPLGVNLNLPGSQHFTGSAAQRILADDGDEWLDDAIPLQSHLKTRRTDPNSLFRFNPVKSHFRRYLRTPASDYFNFDNARFGSFYPSGSNGGLIRKRRASTNAVANM